MFNHRIVMWSGVLIITILIGGLLWWYLFIQKQTTNIRVESDARGFSSESPVFSGTGGSMRENISSLFQDAFGLSPVERATSTDSAPLPRLFRASSIPSTGLSSFLIAGTSDDEFRFIERPSGNILAVPLKGGSVRRITNTLIPQVYDALWINKTSVLIRHSNDGGITLLSFLGNIQKATSSETSALVGTYLEDNIVSAAARPNGNEPALFYLAKTDDGVVGILVNSDGKKPRRLWSSPLSGWNVYWISDDTIVLSQKAAEGIIGSAYTISVKTGTLSLLVGNKDGLSVRRHPTKNAILYSASLNGSLKLYARVDGVVIGLPLATFAEKCVWAQGKDLRAYCAAPNSLPGVPLPDAWYRGEVSFTDQWFTVDPIAGTATLLINLVQERGSGSYIDVLNPSIDASGKRLFFVDKTTGTPWVLTI